MKGKGFGECCIVLYHVQYVFMEMEGEIFGEKGESGIEVLRCGIHRYIDHCHLL